ncbi:hypothetical protein D9M72_582470 [compost metagenome]
MHRAYIDIRLSAVDYDAGDLAQVDRARAETSMFLVADDVKRQLLLLRRLIRIIHGQPPLNAVTYEKTGTETLENSSPSRFFMRRLSTRTFVPSILGNSVLNIITKRKT